GVKRTQPLKFDHPGLGTTASRIDTKLIIQNDIGTSDAHVLVVHVEGLRVTVTCSDNHLPRLLFFQGMFSDWGVKWGSVQSRTDQAFENGVYHLCLGTYTARDKADLKAYLTHLGSRLVFLIDWNRARKRLQLLVPKQDALALLSWAAENEVGHMAFVKAGGERMIFDALQFVAGGTIS
ncbi:MAG: phosphate transport regulator, partial [Steroidobacteraceae bacterium]|nr:phosphate transport regulator [Deltaproteobacteria bacterium]